MLCCVTFCHLSLQGASAPGPCCCATEDCSDFWLQHLSVFLMNPTWGHLTGAIAKIVFCICCIDIYICWTFALLPKFIWWGLVTFLEWQGPRVSRFLGNRQLWQGFRQCTETQTVPVPCQAGAEQQGSNPELQVQGLPPDLLLWSRINWTQPWCLCCPCVPQLAVPVPSWAQLSCCLPSHGKTAGCCSVNQFSIQY